MCFQYTGDRHPAIRYRLVIRIDFTIEHLILPAMLPSPALHSGSKSPYQGRHSRSLWQIQILRIRSSTNCFILHWSYSISMFHKLNSARFGYCYCLPSRSSQSAPLVLSGAPPPFPTNHQKTSVSILSIEWSRYLRSQVGIQRAPVNSTIEAEWEICPGKSTQQSS